MKKILHVQLFCKLSGVQKISLEIFKGLGDDYEKYIIFSSEECTGDMEETVRRFNDAGVRVIFVDGLVRELDIKKDIIALKQIYRICKEEKFDIVHTHSSKTGVLGRIAATLAGVPNVVHTVHGISFTKFTPRFKWLCYYIYEMIASLFCDKIILVNKYYKKYYKYCKKKVRTIYNAIDYSELKTPPVKKSSQTVNLLYVGRLDKQKDPMTMLLAFKSALKKNSRLRLTIVGDGDLSDQCKQFVSQNSLGERVNFAGWQNSLSDYYQAADIFISSSIYEAFGLTFLEAGYHKLPIISTNVEGIPEVVLNEKTGLLCNPRDYNVMSENIIRLSNDSQLRSLLGKNGYKYVTKKFSVSDMVSKYEAVYNRQD